MKQSFRVAVSGTLLVGALLVVQFRSSGESVPIRKSLDAFPLALGDWQGQEATIFEMETLNILKVKDYLMRRYVDAGGRSLWLYIGYWDTQRKGAQMHSPKNCLPGAGWEPLEVSQRTFPLPAPYGSIVVNHFLIQKDSDQQLILYWYHSQGRAIAGEVAARVEMVKSAILRNRTDGALVRLSSPVYGSVAETSDRLVRYVQTMYPVLHGYLPN
jgi:EpsI family protein